MAERELVGVIGATSFVGQCVLPLIAQANYKAVAFSRQPDLQSTEDMDWQLASSEGGAEYPSTGSGLTGEGVQRTIPYWICLAPIRVMSDYFKLLESSGAKRVVALSSTSRFTKHYSSDASERLFVERLIDAENQLQVWAEELGIEWVILRPTLIYGLGKDKNISEISRLIKRFGFFPLLGEARGLRQPVHTQDVAMACFSALSAIAAVNKSYNISGKEILTYKQMVERVFLAMGRRARFLKLPIVFLRLVIALMSQIPRYRSWTSAMVERMNQDLIFDHQDAARDLNFSSRSFQLQAEDLP